MDSLLNYSIVTGSSKGLGKSFAEELASRGNHLILVSLPDEGLEQLSNELSEKYDVEVLFYETDFSKQEAVYQFADWVNSQYSINILVNNVGIGGTYSFSDSKAEYIDSIININVRTFSLLTRLLLENLRQRMHSYVLNVASMASFSPMPYKTVYPASKAFIYSFSRSLNEELKNTNIFVSVVHPGPMMTNERVSKLIIKQGRLGRFGLLPTNRIAEISINKLLRKKPLIIPGILNKITWIAMKTMPVWFQLYLGATLTQKELEVSISKEKDCMKVLVTGANGFLASNIIRELIRRNIEVRGMIRNGSNLKSIEGLDIEFFKGEIINSLDVMNAVKGCDIIIHTAANTSQYYSDPMPLYPVNVNGTINIIEAAKHKIKRLIFTSTVNTIGLEKHQDSENDNLSSLYRKSGYALSKFKAEELITKETTMGNLDAIIVKPSFMIGAFDAKPSSGRIFLYFLKNRIVLFPPGGKNFIDVACVATAICNSITEGICGEKYVLAGENLSFKDFIHLLYQVENKKTLKIEIPSFLLILFGIVGSLLRIIGVSTELNYYNAVILTKKELLSGEEAEEILLMPKTNVAKAINDAIVWYKENNYLN